HRNRPEKRDKVRHRYSLAIVLSRTSISKWPAELEVASLVQPASPAAVNSHRYARGERVSSSRECRACFFSLLMNPCRFTYRFSQPRLTVPAPVRCGAL